MKAFILCLTILLTFPLVEGRIWADEEKPGVSKKGGWQELRGMTVTLANGEYPPFFSQNLKHFGVVSRIVREAFLEEGIRVRYVFRPWRRGLEEAITGKWDGTVGWQRTLKRQRQFFFSMPIMKTTTLFFQRKEKSIPWQTVADLKAFKIGLVTGYTYTDEINRAEKEGRITTIRTLDAEHNLKMLINGRIDLAVAELNVGLSILKKQFTPEEAAMVEPQTKTIHTKNLFMLLSHQNPHSEQLIDAFNSGLKKLESSGRLSRFWEESRRGEYSK